MTPLRKIPAIFYRSASGAEPVREWLKALGKADRQTIGEDIAYVQYKWPIGKPRVDHLRGAVWEVRSSLGNRIARVLFASSNLKSFCCMPLLKRHNKPGSQILKWQANA